MTWSMDRAILFRLYYLLRKKEYFEYYKKYSKMQWDTYDENIKYQKMQLFNLISHCSKNIPYYQRIIRERSITFSQDTIFEDIKKFPLLTKEIIRNNYNDLIWRNSPNKMFTNSSGGSTGVPVKLVQDDVLHAQSQGIKMLFNEWADHFLGRKEIRLWGNEKEIFEQSEGMTKKIFNYVKNLYILNAFNMTEERMRRYVDIINRIKPKYILSYAQPIYELARFVEREDLSIVPIKSIMTSAGTLFPHMRVKISEVFSASVFNRYGSREVGDIACNCSSNEELHIDIFSKYIEVVDRNGERCSEGELGEIVVTFIANFSMPLIRYKIGDMGVLSGKKCVCGRGLALLKKVEGRVTDCFRTRDGRIVPAEYFIHLIGVVLNTGRIKQFQCIQEDYNNIKIKMVENEQLPKTELNEIVKKIKLVMGENCSVQFELLESIPLLNSGKYQYTLSKVPIDG